MFTAELQGLIRYCPTCDAERGCTGEYTDTELLMACGHWIDDPDDEPVDEEPSCP